MTGEGSELRPGILLLGPAGPRRPLAGHSVAGHQLATDLDLPELAPFALASGPPPVLEDPPAAGAGVRKGSTGDEGVTFCGTGWIRGEQRRVMCRRTAEGYEIEVQGAGLFAIAAEGDEVRCRAMEAGAAQGALAEALLGPALILSLALQGTFCLHAGAAARDDEALAFVGASGSGKSTLTTHLQSAGRGWGRIADDVLPVRLGEATAAMPRFPQLKLAPGEQPSLGWPETLPLAALYLLEPQELSPERGGQKVTCEPLSAREATVALLSHTIAARLFDHDLLERHLAACCGAAARLPVRRLRFPRRPEHLPGMVEAVVRDRERPGYGPPAG